MPLTLSLQFPAGRYVAASWGNRDEAEWPPHPARLCLGLVDALHKSGNSSSSREALLWLFRQPPPTIVIPNRERLFEQDEGLLEKTKFFVPMNTGSEVTDHKKLQKLRKLHYPAGRSFPTIFLDPDIQTVFFHWSQAELPAAIREDLAALVSALPRFGHSSSLVVADLAETNPPSGDDWRTIRPVDADMAASPEFRLRVNWDGLLQSAEYAFDANGREAEMAALVAKATRTAEPDKSLRPAASPRGRHDPQHRWHGYVEGWAHPPIGSQWDKRILVLTQKGGDRLGLPSTWQLTEVFHKTLLDRWDRNPSAGPIPPWLSGHQPRESEQKTDPATDCHLSIFPLAFVGTEHASGHLLGIGIALPKPEIIGVDPATFRIEWRRAMTALFGETGELELSPPDRAWTLCMVPDESPDPKLTLKPSRWTRPATTWSSVTPIILDRHPKPHFDRDPVAWRESCTAIIGKACQRIGLPLPERVDVSPHSPLHGVPPAFAFAAPAARSGRPPRFHIHASLQFAEPIEGPLLLGAGRYRGYGLCLPLD